MICVTSSRGIFGVNRCSLNGRSLVQHSGSRTMAPARHGRMNQESDNKPTQAHTCTTRMSAEIEFISRPNPVTAMNSLVQVKGKHGTMLSLADALAASCCPSPSPGATWHDTQEQVSHCQHEITVPSWWNLSPCFQPQHPPPPR
jgi:hypothetical protein